MKKKTSKSLSTSVKQVENVEVNGSVPVKKNKKAKLKARPEVVTEDVQHTEISFENSTSDMKSPQTNKKTKKKDKKTAEDAEKKSTKNPAEGKKKSLRKRNVSERKQSEENINDTLNNENNKESTDKLKSGKKQKIEKPNKQTFSIAKKSAKDKVSGKRKAESEADTSVKKIKLEQLTKKARKVERKKSDKTNFDISMKAKKIWETVRSEKCPEEKREIMLNELSNLITGKAKELIFAHDTVRVIECLVALGKENHRSKLFEELKGDIIPLAKSKYAKFFVLKMLSYGSKEQREHIMKVLHGQVVKLMKHVEAASVVECAYNEYANAQQRSALMEEFYGPKFALFKDDDIKTLSQVLDKQPNEKEQILKHMKDVLLSLIEKSVVKHSIIHHALREFITHADAVARSELIEASREIVVQVLHTKDGSRFAMNCLWHGTPKDRKAIVKSMKTHVKKICEEEEGHLVMLALFDCVDDTKIVEKILIQEIKQNIRSLADNVSGRKVLQYLLSPRDSHFFHPDIVALLKQGDGNKFSKKDAEIRRKELLDASSGMLLELIEERAEELISSNPHCMLILATLQHAAGDLTRCHKAIAKCLAEPYRPADEDFCHVIEQPSGSFLIKKMILLDKEKHKQNNEDLFLTVLIETLSKNTLSKWTECNRGAFHVLTMLETEIKPVVAYVKKELSSYKKALKGKSYKGAKLLFSKL